MLTTILNHGKLLGELKEFQGYVHRSSFGLSCVNNQDRNAVSLPQYSASGAESLATETMIPVTSHFKPTWQGQADLPGHPGPSHTAEQCVL